MTALKSAAKLNSRPRVEGDREAEILDATLDLLASAELVVGERLHAAVLAAAVGTPFVAVEYQPKLGDFAASVGAGSALVRTDQLTPETLAEAAANAAVVRNEVAERVATCRSRLRAAAETIHAGVRG
jgi:polysaccharide pyruvyl transferase WcaK-like protein